MAKLTKTEMAQTIVQALYAMDKPPPPDNPNVVRRARRGTVDTLSKQYRMATAALDSVKRNG